LEGGAVERFDAAIIGGGAEGLTASIVLARAGLKTIVVERNREPGGRCQTREFHPGFRASPFCDEVAPIPAELFWSLELAGRGVLAAPSPSSTALWSGRSSIALAGETTGTLARLRTHVEAQRQAILERAVGEVASHPGWHLPGLRRTPAAWPCEDWAQWSLARFVGERLVGEDEVSHTVAAAVCGRSLDPFLMGSAEHLLAPGGGGFGLVRGGLGALATALTQAARDAGAVLSCGLEATDIRHAGRKVSGLALADGTEIEARTVISTLDLKRTFLTLFKWEELPKQLVHRVRSYRMHGASARLLLALTRRPELPLAENAARGPICVSPDPARLAHAHASWRVGSIPEAPPVVLRIVSSVDPSLAPEGAATMTATIGSIPYRLFDGAWTRERRNQLEERVLAAIEEVLPGTRASVSGLQLIVPPDIEEAIGCTEGDLAGGEVAPDQMLSRRPWSGQASGPRTALRGLYLAGPSTLVGLLATCASGAAAARAAIADVRRGRSA
jgi:phytoene dehydrogenase-like protein